MLGRFARRARSARWTGAGGAWTTSSSSGCGRPLKYEAVYLHELADGFGAERVIAAWMTFYGQERPHSVLGGRTPAEVCGEERAA